MARDPYLELGVSRSASAAEIRKAFHRLAKQHHPDTNPGNKAAEEKFKLVSAAFDILGDVEKRRKFDGGEIDADGRETMRGFSGGPGGSPFGGAQRGAAFDGVDLSDLFGDILGRGRSGGFAGGGFPPRGSDVRAKVGSCINRRIVTGLYYMPIACFCLCYRHKCLLVILRQVAHLIDPNPLVLWTKLS